MTRKLIPGGAQQLALFDLDNTLLIGDSDYAWNVFLIDEGLVDETRYRSQNKQFYADYERGELDMDAYFRFSLQPFIDHGLTKLQALLPKFMATRVEPMVAPGAAELLRTHADKTRVIITATSRLITQPIAEHFAKLAGLDALIATDPEIVDGQVTGRIDGTPCYQAGKLDKLQQWIADSGIEFGQSWAWSDSINDLPLLDMADHATATHPDARLRAEAESRGWPVISLR